MSTNQPKTNHPFYGHHTGAKFYCLHALADGNQCIRIKEKMLEFSIVLSPYLINAQNGQQKPNLI